ncbi:hypothetical protein ABFZ85_10690 [Hyphococcus formosus]|uniref:hypothetical protein n=1 Tax=Hyphococcus formosus TaxID=3143534 RepID=UPI00398BB02C
MQKALHLMAAGSLLAIAAGCLISLGTMPQPNAEISADDTSKVCQSKFCLIAFF